MGHSINGSFHIDGKSLLVTSKSPKGCFRPYGMRLWFDEDKLNKGVALLFVLHNDIYIDLQHKYWGKENTVIPTYYIRFYKWGMLSFEFSEDSRLCVYDPLVKSLFVRVPWVLYKIIGFMTERQYVKVY